MSKINDRPIVAGSARAKAQQAKRIKTRNAKAAKVKPKRVTISTTSTTTSTPKSRGFPKLRSAAQKNIDALRKIK
jgi:hypothetical protein